MQIGNKEGKNERVLWNTKSDFPQKDKFIKQNSNSYANLDEIVIRSYSNKKIGEYFFFHPRDGDLDLMR